MHFLDGTGPWGECKGGLGFVDWALLSTCSCHFGVMVVSLEQGSFVWGTDRQKGSPEGREHWGEFVVMVGKRSSLCVHFVTCSSMSTLKSARCPHHSDFNAHTSIFMSEQPASCSRERGSSHLKCFRATETHFNLFSWHFLWWWASVLIWSELKVCLLDVGSLIIFSFQLSTHLVVFTSN
jgi:hypothetical protein